MKMSNMFENVKSDSKDFGYNPLYAKKNEVLLASPEVHELMESIAKNFSETAAAYMDMLLEDDGTMKDFPHIKEPNKALLENHRMMAIIANKMDRLENTFKEFNKTIPSKIVVNLCEEDRRLLASQKIKLKDMFKILLPSVAVTSTMFVLSLLALWISGHTYRVARDEYEVKIIQLDKSLQENLEAIEFSEYIKSHNPKIYSKWETVNHSEN